jgi:hypothetical protein
MGMAIARGDTSDGISSAPALTLVRRVPMRQVEYADVPTVCDQLLEEIETTGVTIEIVKNGIPMARLGPVDEAVRMLWGNRRHP